MDFAEQRAADLIPVDLGILGRRDTQVLRLAADWPAGLGDPDFLAAGDVLGLLESRVEEGLAILDRVLPFLLEVRVGIHTKPINGIDNRLVRAVHPRRPSVDMANRNVAERSARNGILHLVDVRHQGVRCHARPGHFMDFRIRIPIEILAAHRDADNQLGEGVSVLFDGSLQRGNFVVDDVGTRGSPDSQEEGGVFSDGCRDSRDWFGLSTTLLDGRQYETQQSVQYHAEHSQSSCTSGR